jgi:hypothetical protein
MSPATFICGFAVGTGVTALIAGHPDWWFWFLVSIPCVIWDAYYSVSITRKYQVLLDSSKIVYKALLEARRPVCDYPEVIVNLQFLRLALMRINELPAERQSPNK